MVHSFIHSFSHTYIHTHIHTHLITYQIIAFACPPMLVPMHLCAFLNARCHRLSDTTRSLLIFLSYLPPPPMVCTSQCPSKKRHPPIGPHSAPRYVRLCVCMCVYMYGFFYASVRFSALLFSFLVSAQPLIHAHIFNPSHPHMLIHTYKFFNTTPSSNSGTGGPGFGPLIDSVHFTVSEESVAMQERKVLFSLHSAFFYSHPPHTHTQQ